MFGKPLLHWVEPDRARRALLALSGGLRRLFVADLMTEGLAVVLIMCAIWGFALAAGAHVMPFFKALSMFIALGVAIAALQSYLFLASPKVRITSTHLHVGARRWRNQAIQGYVWETHEINHVNSTVLTLTTVKAEKLRVALSSTIDRASVDQALSVAGIKAM